MFRCETSPHLRDHHHEASGRQVNQRYLLGEARRHDACDNLRETFRRFRLNPPQQLTLLKETVLVSRRNRQADSLNYFIRAQSDDEHWRSRRFINGQRRLVRRRTRRRAGRKRTQPKNKAAHPPPTPSGDPGRFQGSPHKAIISCETLELRLQTPHSTSGGEATSAGVWLWPRGQAASRPAGPCRSPSTAAPSGYRALGWCRSRAEAPQDRQMLTSSPVGRLQGWSSAEPPLGSWLLRPRGKSPRSPRRREVPLEWAEASWLGNRLRPVGPTPVLRKKPGILPSPYRR